ncbi:MAG: DUF1990 family protein [Polyangiaceae bacterium]
MRRLMHDEQDCLPLFRWGAGFSQEELQLRLRSLQQYPSTGPASDDAAARDPGWQRYYSEAVIARDEPGLPRASGPFQQAREAIINYDFSDPSIVQTHFDRSLALNGRPMLLELKVLGVHTLCGVVVRALRNEQTAERTVWGFRYDTLSGHVESGAEWFILSKDHRTGDVRFRIQATWREGTLPNWWSRFGFQVFARSYQRSWHRNAYVRLRALLRARGLPALPRRGAIVQPWHPVVESLHESEPDASAAKAIDLAMRDP